VDSRSRGTVRWSTASELLADLPDELDALLDWFDTEADQATLPKDVRAYADRLLTGLLSDQAIIPELQADAARILALVLTHHIRNPDHCGAWLNLGFGLRRLAISDADAVKALRLERAFACFDRALALSREHRPVAIRAWAGKALAFRQLERFDEAVRSAREALNLDPSDPNLWLLCSYCLTFAGRDDEATESVQGAYDAYVAAGRPEGLRNIFEDEAVVRKTH
jgi:tetratricopeptide (TPR) repeat protein